VENLGNTEKRHHRALHLLVTKKKNLEERHTSKIINSKANDKAEKATQLVG
jgi:hypothetical protein